MRAKGDAAAFEAVLADVDIALDPWPYCGHTTTADCLTSGVPVVTLTRPNTSRASASLLTACGFADWIAGTEDEYVRVAVEMSRSEFLWMRAERRAKSLPLTDGRRVARSLEEQLMTLASCEPL